MIRYPAVEACLERRLRRGEYQEATGAAAVVENLDEPPSLIAGQNLANPIYRNTHGSILPALSFNVRHGPKRPRQVGAILKSLGGCSVQG
ncbi:hypothetical protein CCNA_03472 [Caulobacter vibrioides NA1000]|uniref:Uncharacterized protein n=1 Tax=Caulobacter vibrioides (strain NA1000 / CB15N) TaxID=565050 RepID=A0A0H3CD63_CAUVN|nr:hypothetical protein [Caulobacter vibrioides]YP_002518845.1 hypothetical protein CCNA_03472 [Caulobacter vibrioides NA1000]ACL96937.1 hypothetical protein CCNA_03472 [Caulobacter vibrioides NA1000]QXZ51711.1 hypothetical protein KZH45_17800 [Caulobacter vibrioides]